MTHAEARLIKALRRNTMGTDRVPVVGIREENAARELERHGLVRFIEGPARADGEAEWAGQK